MIRKPFKKIFKDKQKLSTMISLREKGWTYKSLALVFGVDYSSIYHECKKFHVEKRGESVDFSVRSLLTNMGIEAKKERMYADYLREAGYRPNDYTEITIHI